MNGLVSEIKVAIDSFDMEHARELLREALKQNPSADIYYLASLVTVNEEQKTSFLEKAVELDPFHKEAYEELQKSKKPSSQNSETDKLLKEQLEEMRRQKADNDRQKQIENQQKQQKENNNRIGCIILSIIIVAVVLCVMSRGY